MATAEQQQQVLEVATTAAELRELLTQGGLAAGKLRAFTDTHLDIVLNKGFSTPDMLATVDEAMLAEPPSLPPALRRALVDKFNPPAPTASTGVGQLNREDLRAELAGFRAEMKDTLQQKMKQLSVKDVKPRAMSTVGSEIAGQILNDLGIKELRGEVHSKLPEVPSEFMSVKGFDLADYRGEAEATGPYAKYLAEQLQQAEVKINELPGFEVVDLHSPSDALSGNLSVVLGGAPYNGRIDIGVVPFGVMGATCIPSLRLGIELKHTEDQKARYKRRQAASEGENIAQTRAKKRKSDASSQQGTSSSGPTGQCQVQTGAKKPKGEAHSAQGTSLDDSPGGTVQYAGSEKGQLVLELIAAYSRAEWPLALYLSDGLTYHRVTLDGKKLFYWEKLEPREALYCMVTDLKEAPESAMYTIDELGPVQKENMIYYRGLSGDNALAEQLDAVLPHIDQPAEKIATALQLIQAHRPAGGPAACVPQWLQSITGDDVHQ